MRRSAPTPLLGVTGGPPVSPGRLSLRDPSTPGGGVVGYVATPITDGFYLSLGTESMTEQPNWVRMAGHLEDT